MSRRTPLAWKNLIGNPARLCIAAAGVGFAAVLMFTQNGFRNALLDSPVQLIEVIDCELVAISPARYMLPVDERFPRSLLRRVKADDAVADVQALLVERTMARVRVAGSPARPIRVISVPDETLPAASERAAEDSSTKTKRTWLNIPGLDENRVQLRRPGTALVDRKTRSEYGFDFESFGFQPSGAPAEQSIELSQQSIELVGAFTLGTDFANEGSLLIAESSFPTYFPRRGMGKPLQVVDLGLIRLHEGHSPGEVAKRLTQMAEGQWQVMTREQIRDREQTFWSEQTPVGMIFLIGTLMGFAVGIIICYQILFTNLQDAMSEYATLKAMGYPNRYFVGLVIRQSVYLSVLGFIPAVLIVLGLFRVLESLTGLPMALTLPRAASVLALTTLMCLISGLLALRKLVRADPASLF
ncbi:FtsX-like permease family protein [Rhodopirellula halodulae]|uniref:FtsX-like permease family protein n=1 Tax=Rhodopirellula halodulae TaxID=2894198 RepID=UPI001E375164|nr:FtsX-like permease family protein [Rhodopirellula sp. JC737]MCC9657317.1 ABC transporter [Rhodopirellula sp. JC737]